MASAQPLIPFRTPQGGTLEATLLEVQYDFEPDTGPACRLTIRVPYAGYEQILRQQLFRLKAEVCDPHTSRQLDSSREVDLELRLRPLFLDMLDEPTTAATVQAQLEGLAAAGLDSSLLRASSWLAAVVKQPMVLPAELAELGSVWTGYKTLWARSQDVEAVEAGRVGFEGPKAAAEPEASPRGATRAAPAEPGGTEGGTGAGEASSETGKGPVFEGLRQYFAEERQVHPGRWSYQEREDRPSLRLNYAGTLGRYACVALVQDGRFVVFYVRYAQLVPESRRPAMAELLTRINFGLAIGNFELDFEDGEIRYKTSLDVAGMALPRPMWDALVECGLSMVRQYQNVLSAVALRGLSPQEALELYAG